MSAEFSDMYKKEIESFSRSVLSGAPVEVPASDALRVQRVVEAAYEAARTGKFIEVTG